MKLKDIGDQANQFEDYVGLNLDATLNKLTQELGEFNDAVQKYRGIYCKNKAENLDNVKGEVGDLFFNIIAICNRLGINPDELSQFAENTLHKAEERKELYKSVMGK